MNSSQILLPAFNEKYIKNFLPQINRVVLEMLEEWELYPKKDSLVLDKWISSLTWNVLWKIVCSTFSDRKEDEEFFKTIEEYQITALSRSMR